MPQFLFLIFMFLIQPEAFAYDLRSPIDMIEPSTANETFSIVLLSNAIAYAIGLAAVFGIIGITWGGIMMILTAGDDDKMKKARYIIIYSLVGVLLSGMAYGIVQIISNVRIG